MTNKKQILAWVLLTSSLIYSSVIGHTYQSTLLNTALFAFVAFCEFSITNKKYKVLEDKLDGLNAELERLEKKIEENRSYVTSLKMGQTITNNGIKRAI